VYFGQCVSLTKGGRDRGNRGCGSGVSGFPGADCIAVADPGVKREDKLRILSGGAGCRDKAGVQVRPALLQSIDNLRLKRCGNAGGRAQCPDRYSLIGGDPGKDR